MGHPLEERVEVVRRLAVRQVRLHGLFRALTAALLAIAFAALADFLLRFQDRGLRTLLTLACAGGIGWAVWRFLLPALRVAHTRLETALQLERNFPVLQHRLASAMEFLAQPLDDHLAGSAALRRGVVIDAQALGEGLDFRTAIDGRPARRAGQLLAALVGVCCAVIIADLAVHVPRGRGANSLLALERLAMPWRDIEWPRANHLAVRRAVTKIARGSDFEVEIIDQYGAPLPTDATVHFRATDGAETSAPLRSLAKRLVARQEAVQQSFAFRVTGGDEQFFPWTDVAVVDPPRVERLAVKLHYPAYIGWPAEASAPLIRTWRGTIVELNGTSDTPLRSATLCVENGQRLSAVLTKDQHGFSLASDAEPRFIVEHSGAYWIELETIDGIRGGADVRYEVRALPDQPPRVTLDQPAGNISITPAARVPLELAVVDDLAIERIALRYLRSDQSEQGHQDLPLYQGPNAASAPREQGVAAGESRRVTHLWELAPLALPPGARVTVLGAASDYLPQEGLSTERTLSIITREEMLDRLAERQTLLTAELARLLRLQQEGRAQIEGVRAAWHHIAELQATEVDRLHGAELTQRQVTRGLADEKEGIRSRVAGILADLEINNLAEPDTLRLLRDVEQTLAGLAAEPLQKIERDFTSAVKQSQQAMDGAAEGTAVSLPTPLPETATNIAAEQDHVIAELEALLSRLTRWDALRQHLRELAQLIQDQHALSAQTMEIGRQTLARSLRDLTPEERAELERLAGLQRELARRFDNLTTGLTQAAAEMAATNAVAAQTILDALSAARAADTAGTMRSAGESVDENQLGQAAEQQARASASLAAMLQALSNREGQEIARLAERLRAAEAQLSNMKARQAALAEQAASVARENKAPDAQRAALAEMAEAQKQLANQAAQLASELDQLQAEAGAALSEAAAEMQSAENQAAQGAAEQAAQAANRAQEALNSAAQQLAQAVQNAERQLAEQTLARLGEALAGWESGQSRIFEATTRLEAKRLEQGSWTRTELGVLRTLAQEEEKLAKSVQGLADELGASRVLQSTLKRTAETMNTAAALLAGQDAGDRTQQSEQRALQRIAQLRAALQPPTPDADDKPPNENSASPENNGGQPPNKPPADAAQRLAELKMLKLLQAEVYDTTRALEDARRRMGELSAEEKAELDAISAEQGRLAEMLLELTQEPSQTEAADPPPAPDSME